MNVATKVSLGQTLISQLGADFGSFVEPTFDKNLTLIHDNNNVKSLLNLPTTFDCQALIKHGFATVYSGHQFGQWAGQLGDGRAIIVTDINGFEVGLKGSGKTPYSRFADGKAVIRSSIREYVASEYLHQIGIPSTRCLAIFKNDIVANRETIEPCAIVIRVAKSFIRFGHFEHFYHNNLLPQLQLLADHCIKTIYPAIANSQKKYQKLLELVIKNSAELVAKWQAFGFCHGVINTDNMAISGETIDYGPYAFMERFDPNFICNASDYSGFYSYDRQIAAVEWNCRALATCFQPLCDSESIATITSKFQSYFGQHYYQLMCAKMQPNNQSVSSNIQQIEDSYIR